jgi:hypothetical protein
MVTYPDSIRKSKELKEFYRKEYRPGPSVNNVYTGQRKLHYHAAFLAEVVHTWKQSNKKIEIFEVGAAFGMFLKWLKDNLPNASVNGSELTTTFRNVCFWEYGIRLQEEFDTSKKYDLIASYKVAEHIPFIDKELRTYAESLSDGGFLYISVPTWFHSMTNFGADGFSLDYYYDKNHINVWTRKLFETLLKKCGLEVVKSNHVYYDSTYLCRRNDSLMSAPREYEEISEILSLMDRIKKASIAFDSGHLDEAISIFPCYPDAHIGNYEKNRAKLHPLGFDGIENTVLVPALKACPNSEKVTHFCADVAMRYEQFEKALDYLKICQEQRPGDPRSLDSIAKCYREMALRVSDPEEKKQFYLEARDVTRHMSKVSLQNSLDSITWIFSDEANIPIPPEDPKP